MADPNDLQRLSQLLSNEVGVSKVALLFDMDGVLADVGQSYRQAIVQTARHFGVDITLDDITRAKMKGNANNDWLLTQTLLADAGVQVELEQVTQIFEELYQGNDAKVGLRLTETFIPNRESFLRIIQQSWAGSAIVTGRPRKDAWNFLLEQNIGHFFRSESMVCMEDAPVKPNPEGIRLAMRKLGLGNYHSRDVAVLYLGDTPDDMLAAASAGHQVILNVLLNVK